MNTDALLEGLKEPRVLEGLRAVVAPDHNTLMKLEANRAFQEYWNLYQVGVEFVQD